MSLRTVALIGFGEVGQALAAELQRLPGGLALAAFDLKFVDAGSGPARAAAEAGVRIAVSAAAAANGVDLVICAVTAAETVAAAKAIAAEPLSGQLVMDVNSASPQAKTEAAGIIAAAGGRYIEAAVMSPIEPKRLASPILLGGPHAWTALADLAELGFTGARAFADEFGKAAAAKLSRSVVVKGIEALVSEALLTARYYGVEDEVLSSLSNLFPRPDWNDYAHYLMRRALQHGTRRAEEMREAARTVAGAGLQPLMSEAVAMRQDWMAGFKMLGAGDDLRATLDGLRRRIEEDRYG